MVKQSGTIIVAAAAVGVAAAFIAARLTARSPGSMHKIPSVSAVVNPR
ncbi:MAG: hypothetical protein M1140_03110 [Chloroflexi bacterium]|nr:hypothetical protein [Chloroflexota bacterium]